VVSQYSHIVAGTHDIDDPGFQLIVRPVVIEDQAWIAAGAFVGPGVTVGMGAVLGARGAAFSNLEPWTVYRGNPAREIRKRWSGVLT
jgi:putative colanic acid biosynthesis acetyltransferase WcaF